MKRSATTRSDRTSVLPHFKIASVCLLAINLYGCGVVKQGSIGKGIDAMLTTGSTDSVAVSDPNGAVIQSALNQNPAVGSEWENPEDGARGVISSWTSQNDDGKDCYAFTSTRENFDGIYLYEGSACKTPRGVLMLKSLGRM